MASPQRNILGTLFSVSCLEKQMRVLGCHFFSKRLTVWLHVQTQEGVISPFSDLILSLFFYICTGIILVTECSQSDKIKISAGLSSGTANHLDCANTK